MPVTPYFPTIPVPTAEPAALLETCITMKRTLEMLTGQDQGHTFAPHVFVQLEVPEAIHVGDFWLCTATNYTFNIWNGNRWLKLGDVVPATEMEQPYLQLHQFMRRRGGG